MTTDRVALAEAFLAEAVYRSRGSQAGAALFAAGAADGSVDGNCGLGAKAAVELDLTPRAQELWSELFGESAADLDSVREVMGGWVRRQDALDRKRNHFLRDFRSEHGADRRDYAAPVLKAYDEGLERVNTEVSNDLRRAAEQLLLVAAAG